MRRVQVPVRPDETGVKMKPILQLAFLTLIGCPALNAASTELEILLEPPLLSCTEN
jgi:hypothetical protein